MSNYRRKELAKKITASLLLLSFSSQPYFSTVVFANTNTIQCLHLLQDSR